jgi:DNA-binding CsgD family transcriptional regulator
MRERGLLLFRAGSLSLYGGSGRGIEELDECLRIAERTSDDLLRAATYVRRGNARCFLGDVRNGINEQVKGYDTWKALPQDDQHGEYYAGTFDSETHLEPIYFGSIPSWLAVVGRFHEALKFEPDPVRDGLPGVGNAQVAIGPHGFSGYGIAHAAMGRPERAFERFEEEREYARRIATPPLETNCSMLLLRYVLIPYQTDQVSVRQRVVAEMADAWRRAVETVLPDLTSDLQRMYLLVLEGDWTRVIDIATRGMEWHANQARRLEIAVALGLVARYQGNPQLAWNQVHTALPDGLRTQPGGTFFLESVELMRLAAELSLDEGNREAAREWLEAHDRWLDWSGAVLGRAEGLLLWARLRLAEGDDEAATDYAYRALKQASEPEQPMALIATHRFLGTLATRTGDFDAAADHLQRSRDLVEACALPYERALTMLEQAELEVARRSPADARELLVEVRKVLSDLGARPALTRAEKLLARLGPRRAEEQFGLTRRELDVLRLLKRGMADKEIADELYISHHTVMRHVSSILRKLDVDSRTSAAAEAMRNELV